MQNTRLSTLVDRQLQQFNRWLRNPWRRISILLISVLLGNFTATVVSTIAGQRATLDVLVAIILVGFTEVTSWLVFRSDRPRLEAGERVGSLLVDALNGVKLGLTYGLFVEAFKLGS